MLWEAIKEGNEGLIDLAVKVAKVSVKDVRALVRAKYDIVNPLSRSLDLDIGQGQRARYDEQIAERRRERLQKKQEAAKLYNESSADQTVKGSIYEAASSESSIPNPGDEDYEAQLTVCEDVETALYNYWIYCELFHHSIDAAYLSPAFPHSQDDPHFPSTATPKDNETPNPLPAQYRHHWMFHCMPDNNSIDAHTELHPNCPPPAGFATEWQLLDFRQFEECLPVMSELEEYYVGPLSERAILFWRVTQHQGLTTMRLMLSGGPEALRPFLEQVRARVEQIDEGMVHNEIRCEIGPVGVRQWHVGWHSMSHDCLCCMGSD